MLVSILFGRTLSVCYVHPFSRARIRVQESRVLRVRSTKCAATHANGPAAAWLNPRRARRRAWRAATAPRVRPSMTRASVWTSSSAPACSTAASIPLATPRSKDWRSGQWLTIFTSRLFALVLILTFLAYQSSKPGC